MFFLICKDHTITQLFELDNLLLQFWFSLTLVKNRTSLSVYNRMIKDKKINEKERLISVSVFGAKKVNEKVSISFVKKNEYLTSQLRSACARINVSFPDD